MSPRGGRRPGAGRPRGSTSGAEPTRTIAISLPESLVDRVTAAADAEAPSRSAWIAQACEAALDAGADD